MALHLVKKLQQRHFEAYFCSSSRDAIQQIIKLIPAGSTITWGGSATIRDMGLTSALHEKNYIVYDRDLATSDEERQNIYTKAFSCDYYLSSVNAISEDGIIINIDGNGNRIAAITYGPKHVIFVIGLNKVVRDFDAAIMRTRSIASTTNAARFNVETPCQKDGVCHDCLSDECICNYIHILRNSHPSQRHIVVLVDEVLGY